MHPDEPAVEAPLVRRLLRAQLPQWAGLPLERVLPEGTDNAIYRLGDELAVRLPRIGWAAQQPAKEHRWLPRLAPLLPLPVPEPVALGEPGEGYPWHWTVCRWVAGEGAVAGQPHDVGEIAEFVAALQRIDPTGGPGPGEHNVFRGVPLAYRDAETRAAIAALDGRVDTVGATAAWEASMRAPAWDGDPVWIHGDLDARNLVVEDGRISGVLDWGCLGVGDPACDVAAAWKLFLAPDEREAFRAALRVDDATWLRGRGWALSQALIVLPYYTLETYPELVLEAERWLAETLAED